MLETGLKATLKLKSSPVEIPPRVPPELFVSRLRSELNLSLWVDPLMVTQLNPDPYSNPFVAGIDSIECAIIAGSLSKDGYPIPAGSP